MSHFAKAVRYLREAADGKEVPYETRPPITKPPPPLRRTSNVEPLRVAYRRLGEAVALYLADPIGRRTCVRQCLDAAELREHDVPALSPWSRPGLSGTDTSEFAKWRALATKTEALLRLTYAPSPSHWAAKAAVVKIALEETR